MMPDFWMFTNPNEIAAVLSSTIQVQTPLLSGSPFNVATPVSSGTVVANPVTANTNLLVQSEAMGTTWSNTGVPTAGSPYGACVISSNVITAPDGTLTADMIGEGTGGTATFWRITQAITGLTNSTYTFSVYLKANTRTRAYLQIDDTAGNGSYSIFDLAGGVVAVQPVSFGTGWSRFTLGAFMTSVGSGWYRCWVTARSSTSTAINATIGLDAGAGNAAADQEYIGAGSSSGLYAWGAQLEQYPTASNYAPTLTTPTTWSMTGDTLGNFTINASTGVVTAAKTFTGTGVETVTISAVNSYGSGSNAFQLCWPTVPRPASSTGVGFFVVNNKLFDANGNQFVMRGCNRVHYDTNQVSAGVVNAKCSVERWVWNPASGGETAAALVSQVTSENFDNSIVAILAAFSNPTNGNATSGDTTTATIQAVVSNWVSLAATFKPVEQWAIINICNEWGPQLPSTVWRDQYITAVQQMRAAGYLGTLLIDAPGSGQDPPTFSTLTTYASAIQAADPQHNCLFSMHIYGVAPAGQSMAVIQPVVETGLPVVIGEFGAGRSMGSGLGFTSLTPGELIQTAENLGLGWISWAVDDQQNGIQYTDDESNSWLWAAQTGSTPQSDQPSGATAGGYSTGVATDLTTNGSNVVLGTSPWGATPPGNIPGMCLVDLATPASIFG